VRHTPQGFVAVSGVCTHMSCLLSWNQTDRTFDCPCHGGRFTEAGVSAPSSPVRYSPLPAIETKVEGGKVWVYVVPPANGQHPTVPPRYGKYSSSG
jgi:Rieske Fe-S protein